MNRPRPTGYDLPAVVAGLPVAAASLLMVALSVPGWRAVLLAAAVLAAHAALVFRRSRPAWSYGGVCAAFAVQAAVTGMFLILPSVLVFPAALYSVAAYGPRRAGWVGLAVGVLGAGAATARFVTDHSVLAAGLRPAPALVAGLLVAVLTTVAVLGGYRRVRLGQAAAERRVAEERAVRAERQRIVGDMHDVLAHSLAVIVSQARGGRYVAAAQPERAAEALAAIETAGRQTLTDLRGLLGVLRTDDAGRTPAPTLADLPGLVDGVRAAGLPVRLHESGGSRELTAGAQVTLVRAVQEALTNTLKHAGPGARATVTLDWAADRVTLEVADTGTGPAVPDGRGGGLAGMRQRFAAAGGAVEAGRRPGAGFTVTGWLPYPQEAT